MSSKYVVAVTKDMNKITPVLHTINTEDPFELKRADDIVSILKDTLRNYAELSALSAPQIGYRERIFCMKFADGDIRAFINPLIISPDNKEWMDKHGCVSVENPMGFSDKKYFVFRFDEVHATYQTPTGKNEMNLFKGFAGDIFQQMYDILNGVTIRNIDEFENGYAIEIPDDYDKASKEDKDEFLSMYIEKYCAKKADDEKKTEADPTMKQVKKAIDYAKDVLSHKIKVAPLSDAEKTEMKENEKKEKEETEKHKA